MFVFSTLLTTVRIEKFLDPVKSEWLDLTLGLWAWAHRNTSMSDLRRIQGWFAFTAFQTFQEIFGFSHIAIFYSLTKYRFVIFDLRQKDWSFCLKSK